MNMFRRINFYLVVVTLLGITVSCNKKTQDFDITVDLAHEMGAGMFAPDKGDSIFISGNFNDWSTSSDPLKVSANEWVYGIDVRDMVDLGDDAIQVSDTLEYKFFLKSEDQSKLLNTGWESIANRKTAIGDLIIEKPTFIFNDLDPVQETRNVTFTVGMSNQQVLGFFEPDSGDVVVVTGSFIDWNPVGIPLELTSKDNLVYSGIIPISDNSISYKYVIHSKRRSTLTSARWETIPNREMLLNNEGTSNYSDFNNQNRLLRIQLNTERASKNKIFEESKGDRLQVKLLLDNKEHLTSYMINVGKNVYEIAVEIPPNVLNIEYKFVLNINESIDEYKPLNVPVGGKFLKLKDI